MKRSSGDGDSVRNNAHRFWPPLPESSMEKMKRFRRRLSQTLRGSQTIDESLSELAEQMTIEENGIKDSEPMVRNGHGRPPSAHSVNSFLHQYTGPFKKPPLRRPQSVIGGGGLGSLMAMPRNGSRLDIVHENMKMGSDGESDQASGTSSDEVQSPTGVCLRNRGNRRISAEVIHNRLTSSCLNLLTESCFLCVGMSCPIGSLQAAQLQPRAPQHITSHAW
uniref:Cyclin-dependent kinase 17 n=1 Tax=Hucho hucho TaxID=62062 RepID=A0A4W5Q3R8_9TELE